MSDLLMVLEKLEPVLGVLSVVVGTILAGLFQAHVARKECDAAHKSQLELLQSTHRQNLEVLALQQTREDAIRTRQFAEADKADRLLVMEYVDLLLPRLIEVASIDYIASDNANPVELQRYLQLQRYILADEIDPAHPESTLGIRMAFLLFQVVAAFRLALGARWIRPLTTEHSAFLAKWESHIEPVVCSPRYQGKELMYREQLQIVWDEMLAVHEATKVASPLNWKAFVAKYTSDPAIRDLVELVSSKLQFIFVETNQLPPRKAMQCRLAIMALYLIDLCKAAGSHIWDQREAGLWDIVVDWFKWQIDANQDPHWYLFAPGDVKSRLKTTAKANPA